MSDTCQNSYFISKFTSGNTDLVHCITKSVFFTLHHRLLDESLPWLEVNKKTEQSKKVIKHAARINHIPLETVCPPEGSSNSFHLMLEYSNMKGENYNEPTTAGNGENDDDKKQDRDTRSEEAHADNILSVVRHRALCIYSLVFTFIW